MSDSSEWEEISTKIDLWYLQCRGPSGWQDSDRKPAPERDVKKLTTLGTQIFGMLDGVPVPAAVHGKWSKIQSWLNDWKKFEDDPETVYHLIDRPDTEWEKLEPNSLNTRGCEWRPLGDPASGWEVK